MRSEKVEQSVKSSQEVGQNYIRVEQLYIYRCWAFLYPLSGPQIVRPSVRPLVTPVA